MFTEAVVARGKIERNPAMEALRRHPRNFLVVLGARMAENGLGYLFPVFGLSYVINTVGVPKAEALSALMLAFVIELFAILGFAALSDRIGRRPVYMFGALSGIALAFPFFWMVGTKEWIWIALAFILARAVVTAAMFGPQAAYFAELFPPQRAFRRLRLRARTGFAARGRTGAVRRHRAGGMVGKLVAGGVLRHLPVRLHRDRDLGRPRDLSRRASRSTTPRMARCTRRQAMPSRA